MKSFYTNNNIVNEIYCKLNRFDKPIEFMDWDTDTICYDSSNFNDFNHLNKKASIEFSAKLGRAVEQQFPITN